ncbi:MAG: RluA family pseudouridine synthase [Actinomycetota bacterium]|nr:RluA family pseudouridine synthase [Actinomycetota bacterium]
MTDRGAVEVPGSLAGERVDRAVALLTGRSRAEAAALVAQGAVRVGGAVVGRSRRLVEGELLAIDAPPASPEPASLAPDPEVPFSVVYADDDLVVVDKPAGVVVHPGAGQPHHTLAAGLLARFPELGALSAAGLWPPERPGLVHRLDKDTSGLLVVARTADAYAALAGQLKRREMGRTYQALALGQLRADEGTIDAPLGRSTRVPTKVAVRVDGRPARTHYRVLARYDEPAPLSLLEVRLETGRTHQIRVHLGAIGHPVAGDARYGGTTRSLSLLRPFLHAARLSLIHPRSGEAMVFTAALPEDLQAVLSRCS